MIYILKAAIYFALAILLTLLLLAAAVAYFYVVRWLYGGA